MSLYGQSGKPVSKFQVEILMTKIKQYFNLQKDRKSNDAVKQEKTLTKLLNSPGRSKLEQYLAMEKIVNILRYINALRLLVSYAEAIKSNSVILAEPSKYQSRLYQLLPYAMGIIYSAKPTGLNVINEFRSLMEQIFGAQNLRLSYSKGDFIPVQLRKCFEPMQPTFKDINRYALEMCQRNQYSFETLNSVGHNFSAYAGNVGPYIDNNNQNSKGSGSNGANYGNYGSGGNNNYGLNNNDGSYGRSAGFGTGDGYGGNGGNTYNNKYQNNYDDYRTQGANINLQNNANNQGVVNKNNTYDYSPQPPANTIPQGFGGSYIASYSPNPPIQKGQQHFSPNDFLPIYQPTDFANNHKAPNTSELHYPNTSSTVFGGN